MNYNKLNIIGIVLCTISGLLIYYSIDNFSNNTFIFYAVSALFRSLLSHSVPFSGVDHTDQAHGLTSMSAKLRLGLPNLTHVLQAMIGLDEVLFFDSCLLPRMWRRIELWSGKLWLTHTSSPSCLLSAYTEC